MCTHSVPAASDPRAFHPLLPPPPNPPPSTEPASPRLSQRAHGEHSSGAFGASTPDTFCLQSSHLTTSYCSSVHNGCVVLCRAERRIWSNGTTPERGGSTVETTSGIRGQSLGTPALHFDHRQPLVCTGRDRTPDVAGVSCIHASHHHEKQRILGEPG